MTWLDPFTRLWNGTPQTAQSSRRPRLSLEELQQRYVPAMLIPSSLSGYVYCETCTCGAVNPSAAPINGVTITLTGTDSVTGTSVNMTATTNSAGLYSFQNLDPGTYTLTEIVPTGYKADKTTQGTPGNGTVSPGVIADINLASGVDGTNNDFGDICPTVPPPPPPPPPPTGSLCGTVFSYCNGMSGDTGIQGVTITLAGPGGTRTATTDSSGHYAFTDLVAGTYTITETPPAGFTQGTTTAGTPTDGVANGDMISNISVHGTALTGYNFGEISPDCGCDHKPPTCDHDKDCDDDKDHHSTYDDDDDKDHSCDNGDHDKDHQGGCDNGDHDKDHSTCDNDDHDKDHSTCGNDDHDKDHVTCDNGDHDKDHSTCDNGDHDKDHANCGGGDGDKDHSTCGNDDHDKNPCGNGDHDKDHHLTCDNDKDSHSVCDNDKDHQPTCDNGDHDKDHSTCDNGDHDKDHSKCDNGKDNFTTCDNGDHSKDNRSSTCDQVKSLHC